MTALVSLERFETLLRKEKDGASPPICFQRDSLNAFIPRFAGVWRFFYFQKSSGPALVFPIKPVRVNYFSRGHSGKISYMKKIGLSLALASLLFVSKSPAVSLDEIQFWTGSGTNRAALVVEWSTPESFGPSSVPAPVADKSLVWGYRFNGTNTAAQMLQAIAAADPRLHVVDFTGWGSTFIVGIGYDIFPGGGAPGLVDGSATNFFTNNLLTAYTVDIDAAAFLNTNNLYWGGYNGPNWEVWTELGGAGGFINCPERGTNPYWTPTDSENPYFGVHGQWELAQFGLDALTLTNGSWVGFSVAAGYDDYTDYTASLPYFFDKRAPASPAPSITALVKNFGGGWQSGQWQAQFISCTNWNYTLERSTNLQTWSTVTNGVPGNGVSLNISDLAPPTNQAFYRVRADQP